MKRILKFIKGTANHGLYYPTTSSNHLKAFNDADYAGDVTNRRSTTGFVLKLGELTIAWNSQKQKVIALLITEAEYIAASQTVKEIICLNSLLKNLYFFRI